MTGLLVSAPIPILSSIGRYPIPDTGIGLTLVIHRHQLPQRAVLNHVDCFVQCEVVGSQRSQSTMFSYMNTIQRDLRAFNK